MVARGTRIEHHRFDDLPKLLRPGDLLVVNRSSTLPASLPAHAGFGDFRAHLSTWYGRTTWLVEPRWSPASPGPLPLRPGDRFTIGDRDARVIDAYPGLPRLLFVQVDGDLHRTMMDQGEPIRYGYLRGSFPLSAYQTVFSRVPGSAEMASAARPFSLGLVGRLRSSGVEFTEVTLHSGVSSLEFEPATASEPVFPEPFEVPEAAVGAIVAARHRGGRVIAVGTTVVRALESAMVDEVVRPARGFTRAYIRPGRGVHLVDGLITGLHEPRTTHLALLEALAGRDALSIAYAAAIRERYLWHEFGDSHLILKAEPGSGRRGALGDRAG